MALTPTPALTGGDASAARYRRNLLVTGNGGRMLTETIGRPVLRARQTAQTYRAAVQDIENNRCNAPGRRWLRMQSAVCHHRARIAADEEALAVENNQPAQAARWSALAAAYARAARHLAHTVPNAGAAVAMLTAAAIALEKAALPLPDQTGQAPLSSIPMFRIDTGRQALAAARTGDGPLAKAINGVEIELLLFASWAEGQHETGYHAARQAVRALDRARKTAEEDPQALAAALHLAEQALDAAEAITTRDDEEHTVH
ncbi:hypothetical protein [Streptomyces sp. NPDC048191]|uniref:hypothetical protein n=1 Tax=Streptomyces sp. NPDC048191 TaxID=3155484 RepID=UPI0033EEA8C8